MSEEIAVKIKDGVIWCWPYHLFIDDEYNLVVTVDPVMNSEQVEIVIVPTRDDWLYELRSLRNALNALIEEESNG